MLAFRKTLEHSAYFLYFPPCVCPFGNFLFFIFYTVLSLHNSHHEEHLFPHRDGSCQQLLRYFSVHCSGTNVVRFGEGDVMQLCICSGVLPVPKQTYRLPFCLSIRLLQTESGTLCVCLSAASSVLVNLSCLLRERQQRMGAFFPLKTQNNFPFLRQIAFVSLCSFPAVYSVYDVLMPQCKRRTKCSPFAQY